MSVHLPRYRKFPKTTRPGFDQTLSLCPHANNVNDILDKNIGHDGEFLQTDCRKFGIEMNDRL